MGLRARAMLLLTAALLVATAAGCASDDGDAWARKTLGAEGASRLIAELVSVGWTQGGEAAPYAPRPLVVLEAVISNPNDERGELRYHAVNQRLVPGIVATSASEVRSIVVVRRQVREENIRTFRWKGRQRYRGDNVPVQLLTIIVRDPTTDAPHWPQTGELVRGHEEDKLVAAITALPQSASE